MDNLKFYHNSKSKITVVSKNKKNIRKKIKNQLGITVGKIIEIDSECMFLSWDKDYTEEELMRLKNLFPESVFDGYYGTEIKNYLKVFNIEEDVEFAILFK